MKLFVRNVCCISAALSILEIFEKIEKFSELNENSVTYISQMCSNHGLSVLLILIT